MLGGTVHTTPLGFFMLLLGGNVNTTPLGSESNRGSF
jgi:hypothetical protein